MTINKDDAVANNTRALAATSHIAPDAAAIQSADAVTILREALSELCDIVQGVLDDGDSMDSFTLQVAHKALAATERAAIQPAAIQAEDAAIHYPGCWDTAAYPTVSDALSAVYDHFKCSECSPTIAPEASELPPKMQLGENALEYVNGWNNCRAAIAMHRAAAEPVPTEPIMFGDRPVESMQIDLLCRVLGEVTVFDAPGLEKSWNELVRFYLAHRTTKPAASEAVGVQAVEAVQANVMPPVAAPVSQHVATAVDAADFIDKRAQEYLDGNAGTEHDTGAITWHYGEAGRDYYNTLTELAEELRALPATAAPVPRVGGITNDSTTNLAAPAAPTDAVTLTQQQLSDYRARIIAETVDKFAGAPTDAEIRDKALEEAAALVSLAARDWERGYEFTKRATADYLAYEILALKSLPQAPKPEGSGE